MPEKNDKVAKRQARQAAQLRENLRRRKAQARARRSEPKNAAEGAAKTRTDRRGDEPE